MQCVCAIVNEKGRKREKDKGKRRFYEAERGRDGDTERQRQ